MDNPRVVEIYKQARKDFEEFVGETPEDYKVLLFIDPDLHTSCIKLWSSVEVRSQFFLKNKLKT